MADQNARAIRWADRENTRRRAAHQATLAAWQADDRALYGFVERAKAGPATPAPGSLVLKRGEHVVEFLPRATLVECARGPGQYAGGYSGFSYAVTRRLRYSAGGTRGTYTPGVEELKIRDTGTAVVTTQRVVFQGGLKAREWAFAKLIGYQHAESAPYTALHVSNRQNVSGLLYDPAAAPHVHFALALAIAAHQGRVAELVAALEAERRAHWAVRPPEPALATPEQAPRSVLPFVKMVYLGKAGQSVARRVVQGAVAFTITGAFAGAALSPATSQTSASSTPKATVTQAPAATTAPPPVRALVPATKAPSKPTVRPTTAKPKPVATTTAPKPVASKPVAPKPAPTTTPPAPKPVALATCGAPANPWGYNFCGRGGVISDPPADFCVYFDCIPSFWESTNGYVMQCSDATYSHSGGRQGSCSHHGGNARALTG